MSAADSSYDTIFNHLGRWNTDIAAGWEVGLQGKRRINGKLFSRHAPEHLLEQKENAGRLYDWLTGRDGAMEFRERKNRSKNTYVTATKRQTGEVVCIARKGWAVNRGQVTTQLEKQGCAGDVIFNYYDGKVLKKTINAGI